MAACRTPVDDGSIVSPLRVTSTPSVGYFIPFVGLQSTFELAEYAGLCQARLQSTGEHEREERGEAVALSYPCFANA